MSKADSQELDEILKNAPDSHSDHGKACSSIDDCCGEAPAIANPYSRDGMGGYCQWSTSDNKRFIPSSKTAKKLVPGVYDIQHSNTIGIYFEQIPVLTTGLLRFPETNSDKVVAEIQKFWKKEDIFRHYNLTYKRGIILWGPPGCHANGTLVRMYDGTAKKVEDVRVGDELMGPDSRPRKVLELKRGRDEMYRIVPTKGESFVVNAHHLLHLELEGGSLFRRKSRSKVRPGVYYTRTKYRPATIDVSVAEYLNFSKTRRELYKLRYTGVEYTDSHQELPIDPYFLGLWLGDGSKHYPHITNEDPAVVKFVHEYAEQRGLQVRVDQPGGESDCPTYALVAPDRPLPGRSYNCLQNDLRSLDLLFNKHIPSCYLRSSRDVRLRLLAGLLDTDGHNDARQYSDKGYKGSFEITQKSQRLAEDIVSLARSLGFLATIRPVRKTIKKLGFEGAYHRVIIGGDLSCVPLRIGHKQAVPGRPNKINLRTGIKEITSLGDGDYYGFSLSGDQLYLTADYLIHHNSGKSCTIQLIMRDVVERGGVVIKFAHPTLFVEGIRKFREIQPDTPVVILMEDIDSILEMYSESEVLNILDGVNQIEKVVFLATTNYPEKLGARIINRPSRFDKRFKIGHPNEESRRLYFEYIIGKEKIKSLKIDLDKWVEDTEEFPIAHLKELFTAVVILGDEYDDAIEALSCMKEEAPNSANDEQRKQMGFGGNQKRARRNKPVSYEDDKFIRELKEM